MKPYQIFICTILISTFLIKAMDMKQPFDAIINLGGDCQVAYQLYIHGLRKYALPFDSLITPYKALAEILENKFEGFMTPDNFKLMIDEENKKYILDTRYETRLLHDFKLQENFLKEYDNIAAKYNRRIERLFYLIANSEYPLFIRKNINHEQTIHLKELLYRIRTGKSFVLIVVDDTEEIKTNWQLENVHNYYLRQPNPYIWKGDAKAWKEIFYTLRLTISNAKASTDEH